MFPPPSRLKESEEQRRTLSSHSFEGTGERQERNTSYSNGHDERHHTEFRRSNRHSSHRHRDYEEDETESSRHHSRSRRDQRNQDHWDDVSKNTLGGDWDAATPLQSISHRSSHMKQYEGRTPSRNTSEPSTPMRNDFTGELTQDTPMRYGGGRSHSDLVDDDDGDGGVTIESSDGDPFYDHEDGLATEDGRQAFVGDEKQFQEKEMSYRRSMGEKKAPRISAQQNAFQLDQEKWENTLLQASGVASQQGITEEEDDFKRDVLIVTSVRPPFLIGNVQFKRQTEMVSTVKDITADFAVLARKGSELLKVSQLEKAKNHVLDKDRYWDLARTKMGKLMGLRQVKDKKEENDIQTDQELQDENSYAKQEEKEEASSEFAKTKTIQEQREFLPIYSVREELINVIRENQIVVIVGETGSGKTTQLTQYLYEEGFARNGLIGCTQPRRVAASSVAKRVAKEKGGKVGDLVGYAIRFEDCTSKDTRIKYMTDGILLRESMSDPYLDQYSVIIMDEAHERSLNTDVLFGIMRRVMKKRTDLKLIVTSATMNSDRFSDFFGGIPVFNIPGRTFPVQTFYQKSPCEDYVESVVNQILTIHLSYDPGDILVFMTGQADIECVCDNVNEKINKLEKKCNPLLVLPMFSLQTAAKQSLVFEKTPEGMRKCVVCTNIAETSLTVDGIKYVIDSGYCKLKVFNPAIGMDALQVTPVSKANAEQRKGRAGRTGPGICFRMYTEYMFETQTLDNQVPEIQRTNLCNVILLLKSMGIDDIYDFDFMDPPPQENITNSLYQLWVLGALTNTGSVSDIGKKMVEFPLDPYLQKMMVMGEKLNCTAEIVVIVAMLSVPNIFDRPTGKEEEADNIRANFAVPESDHLTYLNVFLQWKRAKYSNSWCERNYIDSRAMQRVRSVRRQLLELMKQQKIPHVSCGYNWDVVRKAVCSAYFFNAARIKGIGSYINMLTGTPCQLHPSSSLFGLGYTPDYVVYHELVMTTKEYMRCVTAVDAQWLAELAPMFFKLKVDNMSRLTSKREEKKHKEAMDKEMKEERERQLEKDKEKKEVQPKKSNIMIVGGSLKRGQQLRQRRRSGL